jgi:hypothetical protein
MQKNMAHPENIEEEAVEGCELYLGYSVEYYHAFVEAVELE